jgi:hypothetical protein
MSKNNTCCDLNIELITKAKTLKREQVNRMSWTQTHSHKWENESQHSQMIFPF